jgi:hypothetical protein
LYGDVAGLSNRLNQTFRFVQVGRSLIKTRCFRRLLDLETVAVVVVFDGIGCRWGERSNLFTFHTPLQYRRALTKAPEGFLQT